MSPILLRNFGWRSSRSDSDFRKTEFRITGEDLASCITERTRVVVLPYPNNPTGAIMERHNLEDIAQVLREQYINRF